MSKIETRDDLFEYVHSRLGSPCLNTSDLTRAQFEFIVDEVIDRFYEQAIGFAQEERVLYMPVTAGVGYVDLSDVSPQPTAVIETFDGYDANVWSNLNTLFTVENMMVHKWGFNLTTPDLVTFQMIYHWMDFFKTLYGLKYKVEINEHGKIAHILPIPKYDGGIFSLVYVKRPESELYKFSWIRKYTLAKCLVQIGMNRSKFSSITLPGGATLNGDVYLTKGEQMITQLDEELKMEWSEPPDFRIG
jgi:hypothetical protein